MGEQPEGSRTRFAVCICTRNRPVELGRALSSLDGADAVLEQIVVSDDSDEPYVDANAAAVEGHPRLTLVRGPRRGLAANRNHCLARLEDAVDAVVFLDDDACLRPGFLTVAERALRGSPRTILTGHEFKDGTDVTPRNLSFWGHQEVVPSEGGDLHGICINATVFPRKLFCELRFDEQLVYGSEEADIAAQAEAAGYRIVFVPELAADHHPSPANRSEYERHLDVSRLYSTYKRYRWLEQRKWKAASYALLAPTHHIFSSTRRGGLAAARDAVEVVWRAGAKVRQSQARGRNTPQQ